MYSSKCNDNIVFTSAGTVTPPAPVSIQTRGGSEKRKKNYRNQHEDVERDVSKAINKVLGIEEPAEPEITILEPRIVELPVFNDDLVQHELMLEAQARALGHTIEQLEQALKEAELDDEEAILLLI